jgi:hypothetical protein
MGWAVWLQQAYLNKDKDMKKFALATAFALTATTAFAGGLDDPIIEEPVIIEETSSSAGGILVPLLFLVFAAAAAS